MQAIRTGYQIWRCIMLMTVFLLIPACSVQPATERRTLEWQRMVDLAHVITEDMPQPAQNQPVRFAYDPNDHSVRALQIDVRTGTSLTLLEPIRQPATVDQLSPREQLAPAVVIDVRAQAWNDPTFRLDRAALLDWEAQHGPIPSDSMVLLATGWDLHWGDSAAYLNRSADGHLQVPGFSPEVLRLLANDRAIRGIGVDTPSALLNTPDLVLASDIGPWWLLENLTRLEQLPPTGSHLVIGSLRIQASRSSPASVLAFVP
jgi:kynurenine formamidase